MLRIRNFYFLCSLFKCSIAFYRKQLSGYVATGCPKATKSQLVVTEAIRHGSCGLVAQTPSRIWMVSNVCFILDCILYQKLHNSPVTWKDSDSSFNFKTSIDKPKVINLMEAQDTNYLICLS